MKITLQKLTVKNFKGIKGQTFEPNGKNATISGQNASGKTTLADAFFYCLFGKDSAGSAQFSIKPLDHEGSDIHNLETTVEIVLNVDGKGVALKKRFTEKWVKARGSAKKEFQGHTTDHFIDGIPLKKKEYDERVAAIFDLSKFNLVTNPTALNNMHWKDRRDILLSMCDTVADADVIASDPDLEGMNLPGDINDHVAKLKAEQKEINKELQEIPVRIQENQDVAVAAQKPDEQKKKNLDYRLNEAREKLRQIQSNERVSALQVRLNEIRAEIMEKKSAAGSGIEGQRKPIREQIEKKGQQLREIKARTADLEDQVRQDENRNRLSREALESMRKEWQQIKAREYDGSESCPTCGQGLPEDQIQAAVEKFNQAKARDLAANVEKGREIARGTTSRQNAIDDAKNKIADQHDIAQRIKSEIDRLDKEYAGMQPAAVDTADLDREFVKVEEEIKAIKNGSSIQECDTLATIAELEKQTSDWQEKEAAYKAAQKAGDRVKDLGAQEKALAAKYEDLEAKLFLAEKFISRQAELIEENANKLFSLVKWKLFNTQINGGVEPTCVATYQGVPYPDLNTGAKVQIGLDIINTLSRHFDLSCPIWVDNRESVTWLPEVDAQVISLAVVERMDKDFNRIDGLFFDFEEE
jgi:DNA repair exonuclease SbcCD ATPase subunit